MNFYNEDEKKEGAPVTPLPSSPFKKKAAFGKLPMFSRTAGSIMDRLKNMSRKDMAFVGIGLSVLVLAPVAEYMMSQPSPDNLLTGGFGDRGRGGAGIYEPGINALSQGSPDGSGEVITPLSSRDPASLILGSQPAQPVMPPPSTQSGSLRDAMKDAGRSAFSAAAKSAGAPTPIPRMQAALRGVGSFFSGGEGSRTVGSLGGGKIIDDARSASGKAAKRSMVGPVAMAGYKGVASNTPNSSSKGAFEKLRSKAGQSADSFSGGSAIRSLDKAASDAFDVSGRGGIGAGGDSEKTTKPSGSTTKYDRSTSGESLAEAAAKSRQQKALEWEYYKKYEIPKKIIEAVLTGITGPLTEMIKGDVSHIFGLDASAPPSFCWQPAVCPTGDCAGAVTLYKKRAPVDLCYDPGAQKFSWEASGKDKGAGAQVNCICGKSNKPIGKEYVPGGSAPDSAPGSGGMTPAKISQDSVKYFEVYDGALNNVLDNVRSVETALAEKKTDAELKAQFAVLGDAFDKLDDAARNPAKNSLSNLSTRAREALNEYSGQLTAKQSEFNGTETEYKKYDAAIKRIEADIKDGKLQTNAAKGIEAERTANSETVTQIIGAHGPEISGNIETARKLLAVHTSRMSAYTQQLGAVNASIETIVTAHSAIAPDARKIITAETGTYAEKLSLVSGRPALAAGGSAKSARVGAEPLRKAAQLRALEWEKLWAQQREFDSTKAAKAEIDAWEFFDKGINSGSAAAISAPGNLVDNAARSGEIKAGLTGASADFANITTILGTAKAHITQAKAAMSNLVKPCYFDEGGCGGAVPANTGTGGNTDPGANPGVNPGAAPAGLGDASNNASTILSDLGPQLADARSRYALVVNDGKCVSGECRQFLEAAKGNLGAMNRYDAELKKLQGELKPGVTPERLAQIKDRLAQIRTDLGRQTGQFDSNIKKASELGKAVSAVNPQPKPSGQSGVSRAAQLRQEARSVKADASRLFGQFPLNPTNNADLARIYSQASAAHYTAQDELKVLEAQAAAKKPDLGKMAISLEAIKASRDLVKANLAAAKRLEGPAKTPPAKKIFKIAGRSVVFERTLLNSQEAKYSNGVALPYYTVVCLRDGNGYYYVESGTKNGKNMSALNGQKCH